MKREKLDWHSIALVALGGLIGSLLGLLLLKGAATAIAANTPAFWFVSRAAGVVAYVLLWASTAWGILMGSKVAKQLVPGPMAFTLHNVTTWLALGFSAVHAWALLGDRVVSFRLVGILLPFAADYQPVLTGLGTLSLYAGLLISLSFYFTKQLGHRTWRLIHMLSYLMFLGVTLHGVLLGTDSSTPVMQFVYLLAGGSVLFLTLFRVLTAAIGSAAPNRAQAGRGRRTAPLG
jgi:predicted ferric reductase